MKIWGRFGHASQTMVISTYGLTDVEREMRERERERERERILFATALQAYKKGYKPI